MIEIFKSTVEPPNGEKLRKFNNVWKVLVLKVKQVQMLFDFGIKAFPLLRVTLFFERACMLSVN